MGIAGDLRLRVSAGFRPDFPWTRGRACCHLQQTTFDCAVSKDQVRLRVAVDRSCNPYVHGMDLDAA